MIEIILFLLALTPTELENTYCSNDAEYKLPMYDNYEILFSTMRNEVDKNRITQYFLSKFPNSQYEDGGVDESYPPRLHSHYVYNSENRSAELKFYYHPCRIIPVVSSFHYDDNQGVRTNAINDHIYSNPSKMPQDILDAIRAVSLYSTHQKWLNLNNQTIYVFSESVDTLTTRGYLVERVQFLFNPINP